MPDRLSRRQILRYGFSTLAAGALPPAALASLETTPAAPLIGTASPQGRTAVASQLSGVGLYIGNEWEAWDSNARRFALAKIRAWGFDFVCPKVGGYAQTSYRDAGELRRWAEDSRAIGLGFVPFIYTIPETSQGDALMAAQIARTVGIVCIDMEDEWGAKASDGSAGYKGAQMADFGRIYRQEAGALPIIVTGYGDPITRFGARNAGFPYAEMTAWADAYSPQWYIGVWSRYKKGGVPAALDWGESEVKQAVGQDFLVCPSFAIESLYSQDGKMPLPDVLQFMDRMRAYNAPVFVWHYPTMTPAHVEALLGVPRIANIRIGRLEKKSLSVTWDTNVPARSLMTSTGPAAATPVAVSPAAPTPAVAAPPVAPTKQSKSDSLELTHTEAVGGLTPGTPYVLSLVASTGAGPSPAIPLTVATAPDTPGVYVQSAMAVRNSQGNVLIAVSVANSSAVDLTDVSVTSVTATGATGATIVSPTLFPVSLGPVAHRDWQASRRDRVEISVIVSGIAQTASTVTLQVAGTSTPGQIWTASLPVTLPA